MDSTELADSMVAGELGVLHLKRLWSRCMRDRTGLSKDDPQSDEWARDNVIYHGLGLPIEETIQFLYRDAGSFAEFEKWILEKNGGKLSRESVENINAMIESLVAGERDCAATDSVYNILSADQVAFWNERGYLVVPGLFPADDVREAENCVWEHLGMDPHDPETWYQRKSEHGIMVQLFQHPALEAIRRAPKLRQVFAQIWGTDDLLVSTDRVSFNPPERPGHEFPGPRTHWDVSLDLPIPFNVQGLVYLTDTEADQGAFTCVPGFHTRIESWLKSLPHGADPREQEIDKLGAEKISGRAGDLVIWHQALPHGSSPNRTTRPRIVEYVTMFPADAAYAEKWK